MIHIGVENVTNARVSNKNDNSPQSCRECPVLGHSTPIRQKDSSNNVEKSPNLDYCPSPILLPYTQEGGNEVAWDWQSSLSKTPDNRSKKQNVQCETPKGTKVLQKKRNSNSPLLYKPLKRKTIKMENIENIGQFAAELQALNERMKIIKETDKNSSNCVEEDAPTIINDKEIRNNEQNCIEKIDDRNNVSKTSASYDDLFDDSIDDSMARCTQEIEEKFNLIAVEGSSTIHSQENIEREESFRANNTSDKTSPVQFTLDERSKEPSAKDFFREDANDNKLKTYSKLSSKRDANSSVRVSGFPSRKDEDLHKRCLNNNNMYRGIEKPCNNKKPSKDSTAELFDIPDDSFDDCLATCVEDEKLLSASTEAGDFLARKNDNTEFEASCKSLTYVPLKRILFCNSVVSEAKLVNSFKTTAKVEAFSTASTENRKFFKTKSLSDQYIGQDAITNAKNKTASGTCASRYTAKSASHLNSLSKCSIVTRTSVSTKPLATNDHCKIEDSANLLTRNAGRTHGSDVNRSAVRDGGDRFVKYNSTGNMNYETKETTKTSSQPTRCTAEEIERKRLRAKMRLEARRKLYSINNINR